MIEGRTGAHALQLLDADEDFLGAEIIGEVGRCALGHGSGHLSSVSRSEIIAAGCQKG
jgi:hypothetical protein